MSDHDLQLICSFVKQVEYILLIIRQWGVTPIDTTVTQLAVTANLDMYCILRKGWNCYAFFRILSAQSAKCVYIQHSQSSSKIEGLDQS